MAAKKTAKKAPAKKAPAKTEAVAEKAPAKKAPAKKAPAKKAPAKKAAAKTAPKAKYTPEQIYSMIEQAAYFAALNDGFQKGPGEYWAQAEAEINTVAKG